VNPLPILTLEAEEEFCPILEPTLTLEVEPEVNTTYTWDNGDSGSQITIDIPGDYTVTAETFDGCQAVASTNVIEKCSSTFMIANAFSPNGDAANDIFRPNVSFITFYSMIVVNRYGEVVFRSSDPSIGWDGMYRNKPQPIGSYAWAVKYIDQDLVQQTVKGNVTLIR